MFVVVPLGNPGKEYEKTRHNAARIICSFVDMEKVSLEVFVPETFMNESGIAVAEYLRYHNDRELIVMYDDKDLPLGTFRISYDRGDGGHNGVKNIIQSLGTKEFVRFRIGIAPKETDGITVKAPHGEMVQGYVLGKVSEEEMKTLEGIAPRVSEALSCIVTSGYKKAMEMYN